MRILDFGKKVLGLDYSPAQAVFLKASQGEPLTDAEALLFEELAGRPWAGPGQAPTEVGLVVGRRSGKTTRLAATIAAYRAVDPRTTEGLARGVSRYVTAISPTRRQSGILYRALVAMFSGSPVLRAELASEPTADELVLRSGVRVGVWPAMHTSVRGLEAACIVLDEACFFLSEGPRSDQDIVEALLPAMATVPTAQVVAISSPWLRSGYLYDLFARRSERLDTVCFSGSTKQFNPSVPDKFLERERQRDPVYFEREFEGKFVEGIDRFLPESALSLCTVPGREVLPPVKGQHYVASLDQAYKHDCFTLAIAHLEGETVVVDRLDGWKPRGSGLNVEVILPELVSTLKAYDVYQVTGDQFGAESFRALLNQQGVSYLERPFSMQSKMDIYGALRSALLAGKVELLDHAESLRELRSLEAVALPGGGVRIGHPKHGNVHDDFADALALVVHQLTCRERDDLFGFLDMRTGQITWC